MFTASDVIYPIIDPTFAAETSRLCSQHTAIHTCLDLLPVLPPRTEEQGCYLLDLACGPGEWLCDAAFELPGAVVVGIDPNLVNVEYAHALARVGLRHSVSCEVMDLKKPLTLPHASFDLIYGHFLSAWLDFEQWLPLLKQCRSLLRSNGVLRLVEATTGHCSSPACEQLSLWYRQALMQAGVRPALGHPNWSTLLKQAGYQQITEQAMILDFSIGRPPYNNMRHVIGAFFGLVQPFILKSGVVTEEIFEQTYQSMCWQIESEDFFGCWNLLDLQARQGVMAC